MSDSVRLYRYQSLLSTRRAVPTQEFLDTLEISLATFKRDIAKMRGQLGVPIAFDRERGGYVLESDRASPLPGLWFTPQELVALTTLLQLMVQLQPGVLAATLAPIRERLAHLLGANETDTHNRLQRVRVETTRLSEMTQRVLEAAATATLCRQRLHLTCLDLAPGEDAEREVSPQRLVLYQDTWYLDAWCHRYAALRSFALDRIEKVQLLETAAQHVHASQIEAVVYPCYGVFPSGPFDWARLRFTSERAHRLASQSWHPMQQTHSLPDGSIEVTIPYADDSELIRDILRHGSDVEVIGPQPLRARVQARLLEAVSRYSDSGQ